MQTASYLFAKLPLIVTTQSCTLLSWTLFDSILICAPEDFAAISLITYPPFPINFVT